MPSASGLDRRWILVLLSLVALWPLSPAQGQEVPTAPQPAAPTVPAFPPSLPLPLTPSGPERWVTETPIRALPLAPPAVTAAPIRAQLFLTVEEEFTDNTNQTRDNRKSEFRTSIAPGFAAGIEGAQTSLNLVYAPRFFFRSDRFDDPKVDHDLTLRSGWSPSPFVRLSLAEDLVKSSDFRYVQDPGTRRTGTAAYLTNQGTLGAAYTPPNGRIGLSYSNVLQRNDAPGADSSLTHTMRTDGQVTGPRLSLGGSYALTRGEFDISSPYWEHSLDARATRVVTPAVSAVLSGLFTYHDPEKDPNLMVGRVRLGGTGTLGQYGSLGAEVGVGVFAQQNESAKVRPSILFTWTQEFAVFSLSARLQQDYQENFQQVTNTGVTFARSAGLVLTSSGLLFRDLTATLRASWGENSFQQTIPGPGGVAAGTVDRTWDLGAEIRYLIVRGLSLVLGYTTTIRTSTDATAEFLENRVRLGLTYQYDIF